MAAEEICPVNLTEWIKANKESFKPPVCNKLMSNGQLKIMFVGGPNERNDYHIEEGEEIFYMIQGDMCLKIKEKGQPKDVVIKEGEIFVLPGRIPHSPQRLKNTIGLVIERERSKDELDGLRYYCDDGVTVLFEKWFYCSNLEALGPIIQDGKRTAKKRSLVMAIRKLSESDKDPVNTGVRFNEFVFLFAKSIATITPIGIDTSRSLTERLRRSLSKYFNSEQHKTGKPIPGAITDSPPLKVDVTTEVHKPFNLHKWIKDNFNKNNNFEAKQIFQNGESKITVYGKGEFYHKIEKEAWLWQLEKTVKITFAGQTQLLKEGEVVMIPSKSE
eukprot:gene20329-22329_t